MKRFLFLLIFLPTADAQLVIGPPETITETRITRTIFEYVMRAKLTNPGPAAAAISATVTSSSPKTVIVEDTLIFGNVPPNIIVDSTGTFTLRHDRTVPFDPTKLTWTIKQPFIVSAATPTAGANEVGVTFRPQVFFSKPVDPTTLNANNFFAKGPDGQKLPATILPATDATFAWLFFTAPMPSASQVQVTVDGATIRLAGGADLLDAANTGTPGSKLTFDFSTVSLAPLANTTVWGRIVDPGPDLLPHTADDSLPGPDGQYMTEDDIHLLPIAGVKVFLIGLENRFGETDAAGRFQIDGVPSGNVKVVIDGRAPKVMPPDGYYFPEMVMDATMQPGLNNFVMKGMESMYLPRIPNSILQAVSASQTTTVTLKPEAALDLPPAQQPFLTVEVQPGSLVNNGQHVATGQVGISVVPPELVRDMLPPGLLQHTFDITVQAPGITNFSIPARMTFPNVFNAAPGTKLNFLSFDHTTGRLVIEGTATVSENGLFVSTDPGTGITHPGWHGLTSPGATIGCDMPVGPTGPTPGPPPPPPSGPCSNDVDCDGIPNDQDPDIDGDGIPNDMDDDMDGDGVPNFSDNCPRDYNPDQADSDSDGAGDVCDDDPAENINVLLRIFIPSPAVALIPDFADWACDSLTDGSPMCLGLQVAPIFGGDNRGFSQSAGTHRVLVEANVTPDKERDGIADYRIRRRHSDLSTMYLAFQGQHVGGLPWWWWEILMQNPWAVDQLAPSVFSHGIYVDPITENRTDVHIQIHAAIPFYQSVPIAPAIDAQITVHLLHKKGEPVQYWVKGFHDAFPAYELYILTSLWDRLHTRKVPC